MPNIDAETRDKSSPVWDMNQERLLVENLTNQRFNFYLVFFSLVVAASINAKTAIQLRIVLTVGAFIAALLGLAVAAAQIKTDHIIDLLFKDPTNPVTIIDRQARAGPIPYFSVRRIVGFGLPTLFFVLLTAGAVIAWTSPELWMAEPPAAVKSVSNGATFRQPSMADISSVLLNLAAGMLTGVVTGALSVRFALRRFRAERTWERKVVAYGEILDALYNIQRHAKMQLEEIENGATFVEEYKNDASRQASQGYDAIRRAAIRGTFVVGPAAAARLEQLVTIFDDPHYGEDVHEEITADLNAARKALVELRAIANTDVYEADAFERRRIN